MDTPREAVALFDYKGQRSEELGLTEGDTVLVIEADPTAKWWRVKTLDELHEGYVLGRVTVCIVTTVVMLRTLQHYSVIKHLRVVLWDIE